MPSFKAPSGDTTSSRIKSLVLYVERSRGRAEADDFLQEVGVGRDLLVDETRRVSVAMWRKALDQFVRRYGEPTLDEIGADVTHPTNLGPWIHVVRNAETVADAFRLLEGATTQMNSTTRIETLSVEGRTWRGRVHVLHDPALERGGILSRARRVEISAVPTLFGLPPAHVEELASLDRGDGFYEYSATWTVPSPLPSYATLGALFVGASTGVGFAVHDRLGALLGGFFGLTSAAALVFRGLDGATRAIRDRAQSIRIRALERSLELQEVPELTQLGDLDGQIIAGLYRLHARLGSGATGVIYEALRLSDRTPVAVKLLRTAVAADAVAADRLVREAEALRLTWHPNVVELLDHGQLPDGTAYLVMELLRGETLATRLSRQKTLGFQELAPLLDQVCDALSAMHAAGVVHRDLKPSNIYLCDPQQNLRSSNNFIPKDPAAPRVKIFDFGIAKVEWAETRITNIGVPLGTPGYMAPEQESGDGVDLRADLFAVGALAFECLTGRPPPLHARTDTAGRDALAGLDAPLRALIERAMAKDPKDRFPDARSLQVALHEVKISSGTIEKAQASA